MWNYRTIIHPGVGVGEVQPILVARDPPLPGKVNLFPTYSHPNNRQ